MKLANSTQISKLENLLTQIIQTNDVNKKRGHFTSAIQILNDVDSFSTYRSQLSIEMIGANSVEKLQEPTEILRGAIDYYKNHLPLATPKPPVQEPKSQITQPQNKIDLEKQKALSENAKLKQAEQNRLKSLGNWLFASLVFFVPLVCGIYFIVALFKFKTMSLADPTTWIDRDKFGDLEFLIILFELVVIGTCGWIYKKYKIEFVSWFYERQRTKLN